MWLYIKCVYWNKWTLSSYGALCAAIFALFAPNLTVISLDTCMVIMVISLLYFAITFILTQAGTITRESYLRTTALLTGKKMFYIRSDETTTYCGRVGVIAAEREYARRHQ